MWKAAADRVVIQKDTNTGPKRTAGGLYLPDRMKSKGIDEGAVLAAGPDAKGVEIGDKVFFISTGNSGALEVQPGIFSVNADYILAIQRDVSGAE
jgi:co-chaperonin GroES (HSP10)